MRMLFDFACLSVLEAVSYTRKDGQYLRWDERANRKNGGKIFEFRLPPTLRPRGQPRPLATRNKPRSILRTLASLDN